MADLLLYLQRLVTQPHYNDIDSRAVGKKVAVNVIIFHLPRKVPHSELHCGRRGKPLEGIEVTESRLLTQYWELYSSSGYVIDQKRVNIRGFSALLQGSEELCLPHSPIPHQHQPHRVRPPPLALAKSLYITHCHPLIHNLLWRTLWKVTWQIQAKSLRSAIEKLKWNNRNHVGGEIKGLQRGMPQLRESFRHISDAFIADSISSQPARSHEKAWRWAGYTYIVHDLTKRNETKWPNGTEHWRQWPNYGCTISRYEYKER